MLCDHGNPLCSSEYNLIFGRERSVLDGCLFLNVIRSFQLHHLQQRYQDVFNISYCSILIHGRQTLHIKDPLFGGIHMEDGHKFGLVRSNSNTVSAALLLAIS